VPKQTKKYVFYVDTECPFSTKTKCSYYSTQRAQEKTAKERKKIWNRTCCPIVYVKTGPNKFKAFCPTRGGPLGEQVPAVGGPSPKALRIEVQPQEADSWADIVEKAAKTACAATCR